MEWLPPGVQVFRGVSLWDETVLEDSNYDPAVVIGYHGGAHDVDCALAHICLPSWQIEVSTGSAQGWLDQIAPQIGALKRGEFFNVKNVWLNDRLCGEASLIMTIAAGLGVRTLLCVRRQPGLGLSPGVGSRSRGCCLQVGCRFSCCVYGLAGRGSARNPTRR